MNISRPRFMLKGFCPVCEQGSSLLFLTCPVCAKVIIACDEEGTLFPNPKDLNQQADYPCDPWISTITKCPQCQTTQEFRLSSGEEIQECGFTPQDYS
jgi:Zn ribbon nucleic-acid-binding protein